MSSIALHPERSALGLDLLFCRQGGVPEHREYQMYLLGYLEKDEAKILEMAADKSLTDKRKKDSKLLLDVLEEEKLATVLGVQVAKAEEAKSYPLTFKYSFSLNNNSFFKSIGKLQHFDVRKNFKEADRTAYSDQFKLMVFVPVFDSKYATKVSKEPKERAGYDIAHWYDLKTTLLYFKPLPYCLQFELGSTEDDVSINVN